MQRKALKTTILILCLCILFLAAPITFARSGDRPIKLESRFLFITPAALLSGPVGSVLPSLLGYTTVIILLEKDTPSDSTIKACGDLTKGRPSEDG